MDCESDPNVSSRGYSDNHQSNERPASSLPPPPRLLKAVQHVARLRGGSQAHLMRCSDGHYYVVKFANNPQGTKILANEFLAHQFASFLHLPIPPCAVIEVTSELIQLTEELAFEKPLDRVPCRAGLAFGSRYIPFAWDLPVRQLDAPIGNLADFLGMLVFDKWTCNTDGRQVLLVNRRNRFHAFMIDNGFCFNGPAWNFPDSPPRGLYAYKEVYRGAYEIRSFEPWLRPLERDFDREVLQALARRIPADWYGSEHDRLAALIDKLDGRRVRTRELLMGTLGYCKQKCPIEPHRVVPKLPQHAAGL